MPSRASTHRGNSGTWESCQTPWENRRSGSNRWKETPRLMWRSKSYGCIRSEQQGYPKVSMSEQRAKQSRRDGSSQSSTISTDNRWRTEIQGSQCTDLWGERGWVIHPLTRFETLPRPVVLSNRASLRALWRRRRMS